jgi:hypothetical protein
VRCRCNTDEVEYRAAALALVQSGLKDLGYQYFNLCVPNPLLRIVWCRSTHCSLNAARDCGWQSTNRTPSGTFMWNATRIPSGIPALVDYVHSLGLLFGVYSDACVSCAWMTLAGLTCLSLVVIILATSSAGWRIGSGVWVTSSPTRIHLPGGVRIT